MIAQNAGQSGLLLYAITDIGERLAQTFQNEKFFPFDWTDAQSELYYKLMKAQAKQVWTGIDLKIVPVIILSPSSHKLEILYSLFKRVPKNFHFSWSESPTSGDMALAPGPSTPQIPCLLQPGTPESPNGSFEPLTQCLNPRSNKKSPKSRPKPIPFSLNLSTISTSHSHSTPEKSVKSPTGLVLSNQSNSSVTSRRSPITKARKRLGTTPSPREIRQRNSRILDGLEPACKRAKLDKSVKMRSRPKVKARRSLKKFLVNLFQQ